MTKVWWQSRTLWALVVGAIPKLILAAGQLGLLARAPQVAELVMLLGSFAMDIAAVIFRWQASGPLAATSTPRGPVNLKRVVSVLIILSALGLSACAPMPPPVSVADKAWRVYGDPLAIATDTYNEAMLAAGRAHGQHLITDEQLAEVVKIGKEVQLALKSARAALIVYGTTADPSPPNLALAVAAAQSTLTDLLDLLGRLGVRL